MSLKYLLFILILFEGVINLSFSYDIKERLVNCNLQSFLQSGEDSYCKYANKIIYINKRVHNGIQEYWCIIVDNRNTRYNSDILEIKFTKGFRTAWIVTDGQIIENILTANFRIHYGVNRIVVTSYENDSEFPEIRSIKLNTITICTENPKITKNNAILNENSQNELFTITQTDLLTVNDYRFLNDCMMRQRHTTTFRWCDNININEFMIETRKTANYENYWCIIITNDNLKYNTFSILRITYTSQSKFLAWIPSDSYIETNSNFDSTFQLANQRTIIAISPIGNDQLTGIDSILVNGMPICDFFQPQRQIVPIIKTTTTLSSITTEEFIDITKTTPNPSITNVVERKPKYVCGVKEAKLATTLISFGTQTKLGDWPWHVAVYHLLTRRNRKYKCGGTLINRKTVLTAAHCVVESQSLIVADRLVVQLGIIDLTVTSPYTQEYKVFDVIQHESYNPENFENDIALLLLANYVQLTKYVNFICIPNSDADFRNQIGKAVGWGVDETSKQQDILREASMPVVDKMVCLQSNRVFYGQYLTGTNFCAGYRNNTNVCVGDSGGGLVFNVNDVWYVGGITSLGVTSQSNELACDISQYAIFTDVIKYIDWIERNSDVN